MILGFRGDRVRIRVRVNVRFRVRPVKYKDGCVPLTFSSSLLCTGCPLWDNSGLGLVLGQGLGRVSMSQGLSYGLGIVSGLELGLGLIHS